MVAVMTACLVAGSDAWMLVGALVLVVTAVACAVLTRSDRHFVAPCLDLWAMALGMLALAVHPTVGHHGAGIPGLVLYAGVAAAWMLARAWLGARQRVSWLAGVASGALTAVGLVLMPALH